jgi:hypothetical protein
MPARSRCAQGAAGGASRTRCWRRLRAGITEVILPLENERTRGDSGEVRDVIEFHQVDSMEDVLRLRSMARRARYATARRRSCASPLPPAATDRWTH